MKKATARADIFIRSLFREAQKEHAATATERERARASTSTSTSSSRVLLFCFEARREKWSGARFAEIGFACVLRGNWICARSVRRSPAAAALTHTHAQQVVASRTARATTPKVARSRITPHQNQYAIDANTGREWFVTMHPRVSCFLSTKISNLPFDLSQLQCCTNKVDFGPELDSDIKRSLNLHFFKDFLALTIIGLLQWNLERIDQIQTQCTLELLIFLS
jgi:hypothetical protein